MKILAVGFMLHDEWFLGLAFFNKNYSGLPSYNIILNNRVIEINHKANDFIRIAWKKDLDKNDNILEVIPEIRKGQLNVNDGEQLIQFLHLNKMDILFLDLNMPCKNGYECLKEIRKDPLLQELPITVYSSLAHVSDIQRSFLHRADFILSSHLFQTI